MHPRGRTTTLRRPNSSSQRGPASPQRAGEAAQNEPAAHASPRVVCRIYSSVRTAASGSERPPPRACKHPCSITSSKGRDERPRDGPLRLRYEDVAPCHVLDGRHGARATSITTVRQRLRAARHARLFCRWNTGSRRTFTGAVDGDHPEEEEESEEPAEEDAPGGHGCCT